MGRQGQKIPLETTIVWQDEVAIEGGVACEIHCVERNLDVGLKGMCASFWENFMSGNNRSIVVSVLKNRRFSILPVEFRLQ